MHSFFKIVSFEGLLLLLALYQKVKKGWRAFPPFFTSRGSKASGSLLLLLLVIFTWRRRRRRRALVVDVLRSSTSHLMVPSTTWLRACHFSLSPRVPSRSFHKPKKKVQGSKKKEEMLSYLGHLLSRSCLNPPVFLWYEENKRRSPSSRTRGGRHIFITSSTTTTTMRFLIPKALVFFIINKGLWSFP